MCKFFYKKALKKAKLIEIRNQVLFIIILWLSSNYTNKFIIFEYLLNFTAKCIKGQIKAFSFLFCTACDAKSTKCGEH